MKGRLASCRRSVFAFAVIATVPVPLSNHQRELARSLMEPNMCHDLSLAQSKRQLFSYCSRDGGAFTFADDLKEKKRELRDTKLSWQRTYAMRPTHWPHSCLAQ